MNIRRIGAFGTAVALLVAGLATEPAVALADSVNPTTQQNNSPPSPPPTITVNNTAPNTSTVNGAAASNAGNTGVNAAAGTANQQSNIVTVSNGTAPISTTASTSQNVGNATGANGAASPLPSTGITDTAKETSTIGDNTAAASVGVIGVNSAAGTGNLQSNAVTTTNGPTSSAANGTTQNAGQGTVYQSAAATADIGSTVAHGVTGAIGLNSAAGSLNVQANTLYVSAPSASAQPTPVNQSVGQAFNPNGSTTNMTQAPDASATPPPGAVPPPGSGTPVNGTYSSARIDGSAGASVSGSIGINSAAGIANAQANSTSAIAGISGGSPMTANQVITQVIGAGNVNVASARNLSLSVSNTATIGSGSSSGTGPGDGIGGIGAFNATSGVQNAQVNAVTLLSGTTPNSSVTQAAFQATTVGEINRYASSSDTSKVDHAIDGVSGIAALNVSGGVQNTQTNAVMFVQGGTGAGATVQQSSFQAISNPGNDAIGGSGGMQTGSTMQSEIGSGSNANGSPATNTNGIAALNSVAGTANQQLNAAYSGQQNVASSVTQAGSPPTPPPNEQAYVGGTSGGLVETKLASTSSVIHGNTGQGSTGAVLLNSAAGMGNIQSNAMALLNGPSTGDSATQKFFQYASGGASMRADMTSSPTNFASVGQNTGQGVSGYVAANTTAGLANQQTNQMIVLAANTGAVANTTSVTQQVAATDVFIQGGTNTAAIGGATSQAFSGNSGVVGVNSSAGIFNQQANVMLITNGSLANTAPAPSQTASVTMTGTGTATNSASIGGSSFSGNTGSVGVNVTAGVGNQQANIVQIGKGN